jgi:predicted nucleic acid-binding protein
LILIDSCGWIEYFAEGALAEDCAPYVEKANAENVVTPTAIVYEVYKKIKTMRDEQKALEAYAQISQTKIIDLTGPLSLEAADISLTANLGMTDSIIVATAKAYNAEIITSDEHLRSLQGVKFIKK